MAIATALFGQTMLIQLVPVVAAMDQNTASQQGTFFRESFYGTKVEGTKFTAETDQAKVQLGKLRLITDGSKTSAGQSQAVAAHSKLAYGFGTYSFSAKANAMTGTQSIFALQTSAGEKAIQLVLDPATPFQIGVGTNQAAKKNVRQIYGLSKFDSRNLNVYKVIWTSKKIAWYINGRKVQEVTTGIPSSALYLHFETSTASTGAGQGSFDIDWVRYAYAYSATAVTPPSPPAAPAKPVVTQPAPSPLPTTPEAPPVTPAPAPTPTPAPQPAPTTDFMTLMDYPPNLGLTNGTVKIVGDAACVSKTTAALNLLKAKAPLDYNRVATYVGTIECVNQGSGMWAWENPPRYTVGSVTLNADTIWYAGTIAHDACHSVQYNVYKSKHPGEGVPAEVYSGETGEAQCLDVQYRALQRLGASASTLSYMKSLLSTQYWAGSYTNRWW